MGKINRVLKYVFVFFNVLFAILGLLLIILVMKDSIISIQTKQSSSYEAPKWVVAFLVWCISCMGAYGAYYEKSHALKIFAGCLVVGLIISLVFGSIIVATKSQMTGIFQKTFEKEEMAFIEVVAALYFGLAGTALLGLLMSIVMILQIKRPNRA